MAVGGKPAFLHWLSWAFRILLAVTFVWAGVLKFMDPAGFAGDLYWWAISPFHNIVFGSMIKNIAAGIPPRATPAVAPGRREG